MQHSSDKTAEVNIYIYICSYIYIYIYAVIYIFIYIYIWILADFLLRQLQIIIHLQLPADGCKMELAFLNEIKWGLETKTTHFN